MHLSPRDLKVLVTVARTLSFSRTAELFFLTQPTLQAKIVHDIEGQVGVQIFERTTRSVRLTRDGERSFRSRSNYCRTTRTAFVILRASHAGRRQRIAVAALPTLAAMLLPAAVADLQRDIPDLILKVHDVQNDAALELLKSRQVDLTLTAADRIALDLSYGGDRPLSHSWHSWAGDGALKNALHRLAGGRTSAATDHHDAAWRQHADPR